MISAGEMFEQAILHWRDAKGVGTAFIPKPLNDKVMVLGVLQRIYSRSPTTIVNLIVDSFTDRMSMIEFLTSDVEEENNKEFKELINSKKLKIYSEDFVDKMKNIDNFHNVIVYNVSEYDARLLRLIQSAKFKLIVFNKLPNPKDLAFIYSIAPLLDDFKQRQVEELRTSTPVEESRIGVELPPNSKEYQLLEYYNNYISTSLNIFGSFDVMTQCRTGNQKLNISAAQICAQIAQENGWNENLDMSNEINIRLDELYNPGNLRDRAKDTYEMIRKRNNLLSDCEDKLEAIWEIVKVCDGPTLIINKRGEFANKVTDYINSKFETDICGNYHDKVEPVPATDYKGRPIIYKSGQKKGQPRMLAAQAQKSMNMSKFNEGVLSILSTSNAPDKELCGDVVNVIITSPQCETIESYLYRFGNLTYPEGKLNLFSLYVKNSVELSRLQNKPISDTHTIVKDCEQNVVSENNYDFIVVD